MLTKPAFYAIIANVAGSETPADHMKCAADEARTRYLHLGKVALYQMSYGRIKNHRR